MHISLSTDFNETDALPSSSTPPVRIRLYEDAKAWHYLREILFHRDLEGNINLHELKVELAVDGSLHVCTSIHLYTVFGCNNHRFWIRVVVVRS